MQSTTFHWALIVPILCGAPQLAFAQSDDRCATVTASVQDAGFSASVDVKCSHGRAILHSNAYPDHQMMTGIIGSNEQVPVPAIDHAAPIPLQPVLGTKAQTRDSSLGVAVNGVPIFDYTSGGEMSQADLQHHQARHDTVQTHQLDICGGHAGKGDDYHYHAKPTCMIAQMENAGDDAIIGWAFDGFPIFGDKNPDGTAINSSTLDVCNGQADARFGYRYHTSQQAPYILQCLKGEVASFRDLPRISPLKATRGTGRANGKPPRDGVQTLVFTEYESGTRSLDYAYQGQAYYIRYKPAEDANCYLFESRTIASRGVVETGEYCR